MLFLSTAGTRPCQLPPHWCISGRSNDFKKSQSAAGKRDIKELMVPENKMHELVVFLRGFSSSKISARS